MLLHDLQLKISILQIIYLFIKLCLSQIIDKEAFIISNIITQSVIHLDLNTFSYYDISQIIPIEKHLRLHTIKENEFLITENSILIQF